MTNAFVAKVLREKMNMRFRKVKRIPFGGNTDRSLFLRFECAKTLITLLEAKKRLVSIDESWLQEADMRRRCWKAHGE